MPEPGNELRPALYHEHMLGGRRKSAAVILVNPAVAGIRVLPVCGSELYAER